MNQRMKAWQGPWMRALINAFILFHLYIMVFWGMPGSNFRNTMAGVVEDYVIKLGLWHSWDMFSPDPLAVNFNVEAYVTFADGTTRVWEFPRMDELGIARRYQKERFRKWRERVRQDAYAGVWEDTARYIARVNHTAPDNPPVKVVLIRHWGPIPPPEPKKPGGLVPRDYQPISQRYDLRFNYRFAFYDVKPEDL